MLALVTDTAAPKPPWVLGHELAGIIEALAVEGSTSVSGTPRTA